MGLIQGGIFQVSTVEPTKDNKGVKDDSKRVVKVLVPGGLCREKREVQKRRI